MAKQPERLPVVFTQEEVRRILAQLDKVLSLHRKPILEAIASTPCNKPLRLTIAHPTNQPRSHHVSKEFREHRRRDRNRQFISPLTD